MEIILQPLSHQSIDPIYVDDSILYIGRSEQGFTSLPPDVTAKLSRRHARVFEEDGQAYLTDLDSSNGTSVNGKALAGGRPRLLHDGDVIEFATTLSYSVQIVDAGADTEVDHEAGEQPQLVLKPDPQNSELDTLVINQFPFLVARKDSIFEAYGEKSAAQLGHLSRRHAMVTNKQGNFYVEDLGSKNGTQVNSVLLDEHSKQLSNHDMVAFGGDYFVYRVHLPDAMPIPAPANRSDHTGEIADKTEVPQVEKSDERTMFVDSPTSFLDIFCGEDESQESSGSGSDNSAGDVESDLFAAGKAPGKLRATQHKARNIGNAFWGNTRARPSKMTLSAIMLVVLGILAALLMNQFSDKANIEKLYETKAYRPSAERANVFLAEHPDDHRIQSIGTMSLVHATVPEWLARMNAGDYAQATAYLKQTRGNFPALTTAAEYLDLMLWISALDSFVTNNEGPKGPIDIYEDEKHMQKLLDRWNKDPNRNQQVLTHITTLEPDFAVIEKQALSQVRQLNHSHSLYSNAITRLSQSVRQATASGDISTLIADISQTQKNYPRLRGLDAMSRDAELFAQVKLHIEQRNLGALIAMQRNLNFETDPFQQTARPFISEQLPNNQIADAYERSLVLWRRGDTAGATESLQPLVSDPLWGPQVKQQITRLQSVSDEYSVLHASEEQPGYAEKLLAYRNRLNPDEDTYYLDATQAAYQTYQDVRLPQLETRYLAAKKDWNLYIQANAITSVMRIEETISGGFKRQAGRLHTAYDEIDAVVDEYALLQVALPNDLENLAKKIKKEIRKQRNWINDLGIVLDDKLLKAKLALLPEPNGGMP
jgi:pSer/pThr/pTyr-binding forkhead associated (FHA) protein